MDTRNSSRLVGAKRHVERASECECGSVLDFEIKQQLIQKDGMLYQIIRMTTAYKH